MKRGLFDSYPDEPDPKRPLDDLIAQTKARHPRMVLLFHVGDHYELYDDDALLGVRLLGLELVPGTRPTARFPVSSLDAHLRTFLRGDHRIAVCEQEVED